MDMSSIRADFPILHQQVNGCPLVYLDNAATSQKPRSVIDAISTYYLTFNSNVHRGIHALAYKATEAFEAVRAQVARWIGAQGPEEIIFTRGTTESINLVATSWGNANLREGDTLLLTEMEHHSNLVPWQALTERVGAKLRYVRIHDDTGTLDMHSLDEELARRPKLLAVTHTSNTLGTVNPIDEICRRAKAAGVLTLIDAAQSAGHRPLSVRDVGCDFLAFSGHKMCAPTGIGVLYARKEILDAMPPYHYGGNMISKVTYEKTLYKQPPERFESGTPDIAGVIGLGAAIDYLEKIGLEKIMQHDMTLAQDAYQKLRQLEGMRIIGPPEGRAGVLSFEMQGIHAHDVVTIADHYGVAMRGGHHCNQPLMNKLGLQATARASFYFYNTPEEVDCLIDTLQKVRHYFSRGTDAG